MIRKLKKAVRTARLYIRAHRKALIAGAAMLGIQEVNGETLDWIMFGLGTVGTLLTPNDQVAKAIIYRKDR